MNDSPFPEWSRLHRLPFAARLCLACFLISVGVGYFSAIVQLHFQHAGPGDLLPTMKDVVKVFHGPREGEEPKSRLEALITADEGLPWNGNGQMSAAFTTKSDEPTWKAAVNTAARVLAKGRDRMKPSDQDLKDAEAALREERKGEVRAVVAWVRTGASKEEYDADRSPLTGDPRQITPKYLGVDGENRFAKLASILTDRCARCHSKDGDPNLANFPLDTYEAVAKYTKVTGGAAMSLEKLAQTTHVHLLAFSMLYMLTGLLLAMTRWPNVLKVPLACIPLVVQLFDIACWWLARIPGETGVRFAELIPITGGIVGAGLGLQILLTLFDLFGKWGRLVLVL
ncbi:MAG: hypothetical protein ACRC33_23670, partial [Gemmataceae bacterium]